MDKSSMRTPNFFRQIDPRFDGNQHIFCPVLQYCGDWLSALREFQTYAVPQRMAEITSVSAAAMISLAAASACWPVTPAGSLRRPHAALSEPRTPLLLVGHPAHRYSPGHIRTVALMDTAEIHGDKIAVLDQLLGRMREAWKRTPEAQMVSKDSPEAPESLILRSKPGDLLFTDSRTNLSEDIGKSLVSDAGPLAVSYPVPLHLLPSVLFPRFRRRPQGALAFLETLFQPLQTFIVTDENSSPRHRGSSSAIKS